MSIHLSSTGSALLGPCVASWDSRQPWANITVYIRKEEELVQGPTASKPAAMTSRCVLSRPPDGSRGPQVPPRDGRLPVLSFSGGLAGGL